MLYFCLVFFIIFWLQVLACSFQYDVESPKDLAEWGWWTAFPQVGFNKKIFVANNPFEKQSFQMYSRSSSLGIFCDWEREVFCILYFPFILRLENLLRNWKQTPWGGFQNRYYGKETHFLHNVFNAWMFRILLTTTI